MHKDLNEYQLLGYIFDKCAENHHTRLCTFKEDFMSKAFDDFHFCTNGAEKVYKALTTLVGYVQTGDVE